MRRAIRWTGNILIVLSLVLLAYIYYPVISLYLFPPANSLTFASDTIPAGFHIYIPKINAYSEVIPDVDPWNESVYWPALKKGVAQAKGTALPGQKGTIYLFAHSSLPPWEMTRTNIPFLRLGDVQLGDQIIIFYNNHKYIYSVVDKIEIWPNQTQYLKDISKDQLILQTCVPIGTDLKRLLVFAEPVS